MAMLLQKAVYPYQGIYLYQDWKARILKPQQTFKLGIYFLR